VAGLDPSAASQMYDIIEKINRENGITVIMISHDIEAAVKYATHILHINHKAPHFFGTREEYSESKLGAAFFGGVVDD
jgi:zinc transport system ATP-binding protein